MKKCLSLLLTLAMMLSLVPAASAAEAADIPEIETAIVEPASREDLKREIESEELAEAAELSDEEIAAREERRRARLEASFADLEVAAEADLDEAFSLPEMDALNASATEYTVNLKLNFSSAATRDTEIRYDFYNNESYFGAWYDGEATLKKGSKTLTFSIPVTKGSYLLELYSNNVGWAYADVYGTVSAEWDRRLHIGAFGDDKTIDVTVNGDYLLKEYDGGDEPVGTDVKVTVNLPAKTTAETRYRTFLRSGSSNYSATETLSSGKNTFTETFNVTYSTFVVGYYECTNMDSYWSPSYAAGARYISKDGGITTKYSEAKVFTASETSSVTIDDTKNYTLTGTLKLYGKQEYNKGMYAFAEFDNGEKFGGRAYFPAGETSAKYTIYVPKSQSGTFTHWAAETEDWNSNRILEGSYLEGDEYTLSGNATLKDITLPAPPVTVKGTFSLPAGMKAPSGGLNVAIQAGDQTKIYTLASGKSSFDFEMTPVLEAGTAYVYAYIENAPDNLCDEFHVEAKGDALLDLDMTAYETVVISGAITVPKEAKDLGSTIRLYTHSSIGDDQYFNGNVYVTVLPGQTSAAYELKALKGYEETYVSAEIDLDATGKLLSARMYLQEDGTVGDSNPWFALTKNFSDVDFAYALGKSVSGKISLSEGLPAGYYYGEVTVLPTEGGEDYRNSFHFEGTEGTYSVAVPQDYDGTYRLYYYVYSDEDGSALTECQIWYSTSGMVFEQREATQFTVPEEGLSDIDLSILPAKTISGNVLLAEGLPANGYYYGNVYIYDSQGNSYSGYFNSNNGDGMYYTAKIPVTDTAETYTIAVYCHSNDSTPSELVTGTYFYVAEDGSMTTNEDDAKKFTVGASGLIQDVTLQKGQTFTVTLNAPAGFSGDYSGYIRMYDLDSYSSGNLIDFEFTNSGTVTFTVPAGSIGNKTLRIYLYEGPGTITNTNYYYADGTWVRNTGDAKAIDTSTGSLSVTLPAAKVATIDIKVPAGCSGDYRGSVRLDGNGYYNQDFEFTSTNGSGTSVTFTMADSASATYYLRVYVNEGPGVVTGSYYYYTESGSWSTSSGDAWYMTVDELPESITLPAAKVVTVNVNVPAGCSGYYRGYLQLEGSSYSSQNFEFTSTNGSGSSVTFTLPDNSTATYRLRVYVYDGFGVMTDTSYYYAEDGTWSSSYSSGQYMTANELPTSVTLPAGKILTGRLVSADGSTIDLGTNEDNNFGYISLSAVSGSYISSNSIVNADGTFSVTIPETASGTYRIYFSPASDSGGNVVSGSYYYAEGATAPTTYYDATAVEISGTVPELKIYVETGYVVTGQVKLGTGVTMSTTREDGYMGQVYVRAEEIVDEENNNPKYASIWVDLYQSESSFSYSLVLPKSASSYQLWIEDIDIQSNATTNMYIGKLPAQTVSVTGNATMPDLFLSKAKATIKVTAVSELMAEQNDNFYMYVYVTAGDTVYSNNGWLYSGDSLTVTIPEAETNTTYKLYYSLSSASGLVTSNVYVGANGALSTKEEDAAAFAWSTTAHTLNLLETPPYLTGKIYLPGYTNQKFSISLSAYSYDTLQVTPDKVKTDENGNKYLEYRLTYAYAYSGYTFRLQSSVSYDSSVSAVDRLWADEYCYINPDGSYTTNWSNAVNFTIPQDITINFDFVLPDWESMSSDCVLQSAHSIVPTAEPVTYTYTYVYPGITSNTRMKVTFNNLTSNMTVTINGTEYNVYGSRNLNNIYTDDGIITVSMTISSQTHTDTSYYGFGITSIDPYYTTGRYTGNAVAAVYTLDGCDESTVMSGLRSGDKVHVSLVGTTNSTGTVISAIYDSTGKMLDVQMNQVTFTYGSAVVNLDFDSASTAAKLQVMVVDNTTAFAPKMAAKTIAG